MKWKAYFPHHLFLPQAHLKPPPAAQCMEGKWQRPALLICVPGGWQSTIGEVMAASQSIVNVGGTAVTVLSF